MFTVAMNAVNVGEAYLQANNNDPRPFVWTATADYEVSNPLVSVRGAARWIAMPLAG
jgi:hypothetical protein